MVSVGVIFSPCIERARVLSTSDLSPTYSRTRSTLTMSMFSSSKGRPPKGPPTANGADDLDHYPPLDVVSRVHQRVAVLVFRDDAQANATTLANELLLVDIGTVHDV